jgi:hypothetical protein
MHLQTDSPYLGCILAAGRVNRAHHVVHVVFLLPAVPCRRRLRPLILHQTLPTIHMIRKQTLLWILFYLFHIIFP